MSLALTAAAAGDTGPEQRDRDERFARALDALLEHRGATLSRDELLNEVWGYKSYPTTRTVDAHVLNLRQKLEPEPSAPVHFLTVHNVGYKFVPGTL